MIEKKYLRKIGSRSHYSQAGQDLFVLDMLGHKHNGYYCEVGGSDPYESSNTFLLEKDYSWKGFSVELDAELVDSFNSERRNLCVHHDATTLNYLERFLMYSFPKQIDYLSLDIEPSENTFKALQKIPFQDYRFSVITYEHERYSSGSEFMNLSRQFLQSRGYKLVVANVRFRGKDFEDWWIDPSVVSKEVWGRFEKSNIEYLEIFNL